MAPIDVMLPIASSQNAGRVSTGRSESAADVAERVEEVEDVEAAGRRDGGEADDGGAGHHDAGEHQAPRAEPVDDQAREESEHRADHDLADRVAGGHLPARPAEILNEEIVEEGEAVQREADDGEEREEGGGEGAGAIAHSDISYIPSAARYTVGTMPLAGERDARHRTKQEFAYQTLRDAIMRCELRPGEPLVIDDLARRLPVSTLPGREAIQMLHAEGLVVTVPHTGVTVAPVSPESVQDVFAVLEGLEVVASRLPAPPRPPPRA